MTNLANLPIPIEVLYAGLGGTVLALIVATIQNNWSLRVFFLLTLRLAIGWHFLFEGLYKVNSYFVGPTDTNRVFTSEPYFRVAPGPIGALMRKQFDDPLATIEARVKAAKKITPEEFAKLSSEEQAAECPAAVAAELDKLGENATAAVATLKAEAEKETAGAKPAEEKAIKQIDADLAEILKKTDDPQRKAAAEEWARTARDEARKKTSDTVARAKEKATRYEDGKAMLTAAKATYARWVYGAEARDAKVKGISGDVPLTAPQRLEHIDWLRAQLKAADDRRAGDLGNGYGTDAKRLAEWRMDLVAAESDLAKDANAFVSDLQKALNSGKALDETSTQSRGQWMDRVTMWFLVGIGTCLMAGLFTRLACLLAVGFLTMTYLAHPPFPWYPLPPNTEGNPVFINKNVIEAIALLVIATFPTGKWMGLDALLSRVFCRSRCDTAA